MNHSRRWQLEFLAVLLGLATAAGCMARSFHAATDVVTSSGDDHASPPSSSAAPDASVPDEQTRATPGSSTRPIDPAAAERLALGRVDDLDATVEARWDRLRRIVRWDAVHPRVVSDIDAPSSSATLVLARSHEVDVLAARSAGDAVAEARALAGLRASLGDILASIEASSDITLLAELATVAPQVLAERAASVERAVIAAVPARRDDHHGAALLPLLDARGRFALVTHHDVPTVDFLASLDVDTAEPEATELLHQLARDAVAHGDVDRARHIHERCATIDPYDLHARAALLLDRAVSDAGPTPASFGLGPTPASTLARTELFLQNHPSTPAIEMVQAVMALEGSLGIEAARVAQRHLDCADGAVAELAARVVEVVDFMVGRPSALFAPEHASCRSGYALGLVAESPGFDVGDRGAVCAMAHPRPSVGASSYVEVLLWANATASSERVRMEAARRLYGADVSWHGTSEECVARGDASATECVAFDALGDGLPLSVDEMKTLLALAARRRLPPPFELDAAPPELEADVRASLASIQDVDYLRYPHVAATAIEWFLAHGDAIGAARVLEVARTSLPLEQALCASLAVRDAAEGGRLVAGTAGPLACGSEFGFESTFDLLSRRNSRDPRWTCGTGSSSRATRMQYGEAGGNSLLDATRRALRADVSTPAEADAIPDRLPVEVASFVHARRAWSHLDDGNLAFAETAATAAARLCPACRAARLAVERLALLRAPEASRWAEATRLSILAPDAPILDDLGRSASAPGCGRGPAPADARFRTALHALRTLCVDGAEASSAAQGHVYSRVRVAARGAGGSARRCERETASPLRRDRRSMPAGRGARAFSSCLSAFEETGNDVFLDAASRATESMTRSEASSSVGRLVATVLRVGVDRVAPLEPAEVGRLDALDLDRATRLGLWAIGWPGVERWEPPFADRWFAGAGRPTDFVSASHAMVDAMAADDPVAARIACGESRCTALVDLFDRDRRDGAAPARVLAAAAVGGRFLIPREASAEPPTWSELADRFPRSRLVTYRLALEADDERGRVAAATLRALEPDNSASLYVGLLQAARDGDRTATKAFLRRIPLDFADRLPWLHDHSLVSRLSEGRP